MNASICPLIEFAIGPRSNMSSPFPGMDPYLEGALWTTVQFTLGSEIVRQLAPHLRPRYLLLPVERFGMGAPEVAMEIRDTAERQLVTAIEILSPTNKREEGREEYLAKRRQILLSTAHLLEIDLLRRGRRVPMEKDLPAAPYFVFLSRAERRPRTEIWPIPLPTPLPVVAVPLLPGNRDVALDLQQALTAAYDLLGLDLAIDYAQPPEIPLPAAAATWATTLLQAAGLRH
jgi:Protein of unknown function (DUF4058)